MDLYHVSAREYDPRTARWLQRDPIDVASGDPNLYRYCGNDPTNTIDPSGTKPAAACDCGSVPINNSPIKIGNHADWDWLDSIANFFAGWGDTLSFGLTSWIRKGLGVDSVVDYESGWYRGGEWTGLAHSTFMGGGGRMGTQLSYARAVSV